MLAGCSPRAYYRLGESDISRAAKIEMGGEESPDQLVAAQVTHVDDLPVKMRRVLFVAVPEYTVKVAPGKRKLRLSVVLHNKGLTNAVKGVLKDEEQTVGLEMELYADLEPEKNYIAKAAVRGDSLAAWLEEKSGGRRITPEEVSRYKLTSEERLRRGAVKGLIQGLGN